MDGPDNQAAIAPAEDVVDQADIDSAYEGEIESETTSLTSSIVAHRFENGRRYNARKVEYWAPNDDDQNDQLDIAHHIFQLLMDGKLYMAPVGPDPPHVLDVATGTGLWAIDFADENPGSHVIATDISPIQPHWVPPNLRFEIDDCTEPWTFSENHFDFIHIRCLYGSIADWPELYRRVYAHLKPGGWFEQVEYSACWRTDDDSIPPGHIYHEATRNYLAAGEKMGRTFRIWEMQKDLIDQAGFVDTVEQQFKMPLGPWAADKKLKEIGRWHLLESFQGIEGWTMALMTRVLGWTYEETQVFLAQVREGFKDRSIHAYTSGSIVYGRKPLDAN